MHRGVWLFVVGVVAATLAVGSARADGTGTTTTGPTTSEATTTTTVAPAYAQLPSSYLPTACIGAGDAAIAPPGGRALVLGTPASEGGPAAYPTTSPVVALGSAAVSGSTCTGTHVALTSVSLFGGFVTASSVSAMDGRGTVSGLVIGGTPTAIGPGQSALLGYWGQLTLGKAVGRLRAPFVVLLLRRHWNLPAGTTILVGFAASALAVHTATTQRSSESAQRTSTTPTDQSQAKHAPAKEKSKRHDANPVKPPPDFPSAPDPLLGGGGLTDAAQRNPVVRTAMQYLGIRYQWGGASPKTGFDCSGLVQYVFAQLGVSLPHFAAAQWYSPESVWVRPNRLQPGDLVFFTGSDGTRKDPGHVGIYVGDGYLIDAPHTGAFVRIDNLDDRWYANKYVGATRIVSHLHDARHLLHATKPTSSAVAFHLGFPLPTTNATLGDSLGAANTTAVRTPSHRYWWASGVLASVLLLLSAGAVTHRRRLRRPDASAIEAPSD